MAIDCSVGPPLHIPHISKPYDDQKLMENFQAIQRWADRLRVLCEGCDCEDWTLTIGDSAGSSNFSEEYPIDIDTSLSQISVTADLSGATTADLSIRLDGVEVLSIALDLTNQTDQIYPAVWTYAPGQTYSYFLGSDGAVDQIIASFSGDHANDTFNWIPGG